MAPEVEKLDRGGQGTGLGVRGVGLKGQHDRAPLWPRMALRSVAAMVTEVCSRAKTAGGTHVDNGER